MINQGCRRCIHLRIILHQQEKSPVSGSATLDRRQPATRLQRDRATLGARHRDCQRRDPFFKHLKLWVHDDLPHRDGQGLFTARRPPRFPPADSRGRSPRGSCICNLPLFDGQVLTHIPAEGPHCGFFDEDALKENNRDDKKRFALGFYHTDGHSRCAGL